MLKSRFPFRIRMVHVEVFMVRVFVPEFLHVIIQPAPRIHGHFVAQVNAGLIQRNRVKRRQHPDVRNNGYVVFCVAVTEG